MRTLNGWGERQELFDSLLDPVRQNVDIGRRIRLSGERVGHDRLLDPEQVDDGDQQYLRSQYAERSDVESHGEEASRAGR